MSTIIPEKGNINSNLLTVASLQNYNTDGLAIKLKLKRKISKIQLPQRFLSRCIQENLARKGLEITLEPNIENFDQEFVDNR